MNLEPCSLCNKLVDPNEFSRYTHRTLKDGSKSQAIRHAWCKSCQTKQRKQVAKLKKLYPKPPSDTPCDCCGKPMKTPQLDHIHSEGKFRGWLCPACNRGIGGLGDTLEGVRKAEKYLMECEFK